MFIENKLKAYVNLRTLKVGKHSRLPAGMATAKEIQTAETLPFPLSRDIYRIRTVSVFIYSNHGGRFIFTLASVKQATSETNIIAAQIYFLSDILNSAEQFDHF